MLASLKSPCVHTGGGVNARHRADFPDAPVGRSVSNGSGQESKEGNPSASGADAGDAVTVTGRPEREADPSSSFDIGPPIFDARRTKLFRNISLVFLALTVGVAIDLVARPHVPVLRAPSSIAGLGRVKRSSLPPSVRRYVTAVGLKFDQAGFAPDHHFSAAYGARSAGRWVFFAAGDPGQHSLSWLVAVVRPQGEALGRIPLDGTNYSCEADKAMSVCLWAKGGIDALVITSPPQTLPATAALAQRAGSQL